MADPQTDPQVPQRQPWRLRRAEVLGILAFWTFAALLTSANRLLDPRFPGQLPFATSVPFAIAFFESYLWALLTPVVFWLTWRVNLEKPGRVRGILGLISAGIVIAILVDTAGTAFRTHILDLPFRRAAGVSPVQSISRLWFVNDLITFVGVMAAGFARDFFIRNRSREEETARLHAQTAQLQAQLAEARLEALRMQINPHFLFNTLHAVTALVERDPRGVRRMIARLSELLRYTLNQTAEQEVTVEEEMDFLRRYLEIMEMRFQGRLEVELVVESGVGEALVPNLILQPLVENAVIHGIGNKVGAGRIEVGARRVGETLHLWVRDDGPGMDIEAAATAEGVGLRNVRSRLAELYGPAPSLAFTAGKAGGVSAEIQLPYHTATDLRTEAVSEEEAAIHGG